MAQAIDSANAGAALPIAFDSRTADAWGRGFMRHLKGELVYLLDAQRSESLSTKICEQAQALFSVRQDQLNHDSGRIALGMCCLLLVALREMGQALQNASKAYDSVERCLVRTYEAYIRNVCRPLMNNPGSTAADLRAMNFREWSRHLYAPRVDRSSQSPVNEEIGYRRFFREHGETSLAHMLFAVDQAWIDALNSQLRRHSEGPSSLHGIDDSEFLPFCFVPSGSKPSAPEAESVLELLLPRQTMHSTKSLRDAPVKPAAAPTSQDDLILPA